jgi:5-methylcytosine-specific restriction endonuclease McrA
MPSQQLRSDDDGLREQTYYINACQNCETTQGLEIHHIVPKRNGGVDRPTNRVLLCKECHKAITHNHRAPTAKVLDRNLGEFGVEPGVEIKFSLNKEKIHNPTPRQKTLDQFN